MTQTQESPDQVSIADWLDNLIPIKRQAPAEAARREMTHTDQDRADFEAWLMTQPQFGKLDLSKEWLTTRNEKGEYRRYEIDLAFSAWQAARRALVAKVPVGIVRLLSEQQQKAFEICKARGNYCDLGRAAAVPAEDMREKVALALGCSLPTTGAPHFAWSYLLGMIRELVKCEKELILLKAASASVASAEVELAQNIHSTTQKLDALYAELLGES